jgi:hypothetical protein
MNKRAHCVRRASEWLIAVVCLVGVGCGNESSGSGPASSSTAPTGVDLTGLWRFGTYVGTRDDFSTYELNQTGTAITGGECQTSYVASEGGTDYLLESATCEAAAITGTFNDPALEMQYSFTESGQTFVTTFRGTVGPDGRLAGTGHSTKCACDFEFRAARQTIGQPSPEP